MHKTAVCLLAALLAAGATNFAAATDAAQANEWYQAQEWRKAAKAYAALTRADPANGQAWYRLGVATRELGRHRRSLEAFDRAAATPFAANPFVATLLPFERAKTHTAAGDHDAAFAQLDAAAAAGFTGLAQLDGDPALAPLRERPRFAAVQAAVRRNSFPCEDSEAHRAFDFWIGEWEVFTAAGVKAGDNSIRRVESGCALEEVWASANGGSGRSLNFYDPARGQWVQVWVSADGILIEIAGGIEDGSMAMSGWIYYTRSGQKADFRGLWTPLEDGRVRQYFEQSNDGGTTWNPWFEGFYARKE